MFLLRISIISMCVFYAINEYGESQVNYGLSLVSPGVDGLVHETGAKRKIMQFLGFKSAIKSVHMYLQEISLSSGHFISYPDPDLSMCTWPR
jgi:hypothetical protein